MHIRGYYIVQPGNSISSIANNFGITTDQLMEMNRYTSSLTTISQHLAIPYPTVKGNMIYYGYSDLYKTPVDSPEQIKLTPIYGFAGLINIVGDWLYFRIQYNGEKLFRMKVDGTQAEIVY